MNEETKADAVIVAPEKKWYEMIDVKAIIRAVYNGVRPLFAKKILDSASKWDDAALGAVDLLIEKFCGKEEA